MRELGSEEWNLGYARNFALLYSKSINADAVLFMDDDIEIKNLKLLDDLFNSLNKYKICGANISGLIDDSILGHIATDLKIYNPRMLSGGCMAFKPKGIENYFLNNYNEDWIWLCLESENQEYKQTGDVFQNKADPFTNFQKRVLFQEFGEIIIDGIFDILKTHDFEILSKKSFWQKILVEREEYLNLLIINAQNQDKPRYYEIVNYVRQSLGIFNSTSFASLFKKYFYNRNLFHKLFKFI